MFFFLSKLLILLLSPLFWLLVLLLWAGFTKKESRRKRLVSFAFAWAILMTNPLVLRSANRLWQIDRVEISALEEAPYDCAIVLGGFGEENVQFRDRFDFFQSANRLTQALELHAQGRVKKILITGGSAAVLGEKRSEGLAVERFLERIDFPKEDLLIESRARNTHENAEKTALLLEQEGMSGGRFLLLTDGFHMRRAQACFAKAGLRVDPFSTSGEGPVLRDPTPNRLIVPNSRGFELWQRLAKEVVGLIVYKVTGRA